MISYILIFLINIINSFTDYESRLHKSSFKNILNCLHSFKYTSPDKYKSKNSKSANVNAKLYMDILNVL